MNGDNHWIKVELEENSGGSLKMFKFTGVVGYAVLVGLERGTSGSNVSGRNYMHEVLVRHERYGWMSLSTDQKGT